MKKIYMAVLAFLMVFASCTDDLDQRPHIGTTSADVFSTIDGYKSMIAKVYASFILKGDNKDGGDDIGTFGGYELWRSYFNLQEGTTDVAAFRWVSATTCGASAISLGMPTTARTLILIIASTTPWHSATSISATATTLGGFSADEQFIAGYAAEARFMRAMCYEMVLDLYRQGPYVDENTPPRASSLHATTLPR